MEKCSVCTTPPGCHNGCGIRVSVTDGRITEIRGDPENPYNSGSLCPRGAALPGTVYSSDRVLHPLRKTSAGWKRISWTEALSEIGERFLSAGADSSIFCKGTGRDIGPWLSRLAWGFGSPEYYALGPGSGSACLMPRMSISHAVMGGFPVADCSQYFQKRYDDPRWKLPECILVWGSNPVDSNPDGFLGKWIVDCVRRGSRMVTVDPRRTWIAGKSDYHIQVNPGTDCALAMAFLNVLFREGLCSSEFVREKVTGVKMVRDQVRSYTPERAGRICGVAPDLIRKAALLYGNSTPAALHWGVSVDMSPSALGTAHALVSLMVLSGNLDVPGGNVVVTDPYGISRRGVNGEVSQGFQGTKTGVKKYPMTGIGYPYAHADTLLDEIESGRRVKCAWYQGTGITANGFADPQRAGRLLAETEFSVVCDLFMSSEIHRIADLFLPVCTCLERRGIRNWWYQLAAFDRVIEPLGESRSDMEIILEAGRRIAPEFFPWEQDTGWFDHVLEPSGLTWQQLVNRKWVMPGTTYGKPPATPSGKVELAPGIMAESGLLPAPWYVPPPTQSGRHRGFPLKLTTGARIPVYFHGEHRNVKELLEHAPLPLVEVNPENVPEGIQSGNWVELESPWGRCSRVLSVSHFIRPGVISAVHGWRGEGLNVNELLGSGLQGRGGLGYPFRGIPCRIKGLIDAPPGFPQPVLKEKPAAVKVVETEWCTGCRACSVACRMHTGLQGVRVEGAGDHFIPVYTSECLDCENPPCRSICHTGCLDE